MKEININISGRIPNYMFGIVLPDQNIHRDKGFTLEYEPSWKSCSFLIEG